MAAEQFRPLYPDVLGAITGGPRVYFESLQAAVGIFPQQAFINQPFEVVIILQNMVDQPMQIKIGIQLPSADKKGNPVIVDIAKGTIALGLTPGEVGVLRVPVVAHPPTQPGKAFPVRVAIRYRTPTQGLPVRPPGGGAPPSVLAASPFKLQALREIQFSSHTWNESAEIITTYFDIAPKRIPHSMQDLKARYETLWAQEQMLKEVEKAREHVELARQYATPGAYSSSYPAFVKVVDERFAAREMPLHPGEAKAIAKMLAYTVDEAPNYEQKISTEQTRWFQTLCQVLASDPMLLEVDRNELLATHVFDAVYYDAILIAFDVIQPRIKDDLGDRNERINYATQALMWLGGYGQPDLNYAYLPLILGGLAVNRLVRYSSMETPWDLIDQLHEAMKGRLRLVAGEQVIVFRLLRQFLEESERNLRYQRIERSDI
jgi:hypothetical protein